MDEYKSEQAGVELAKILAGIIFLLPKFRPQICPKFGQQTNESMHHLFRNGLTKKRAME